MRQLRDDIFLKKLLQLSCIVIVVTGLYFAKGVLAPFLVAALSAFALSPFVKAIDRRVHSRTIAVIIAAVIAIALCTSAVWIIVTQIQGLETDLPGYTKNILARADSVTKKFYQVRGQFFPVSSKPSTSAVIDRDIVVTGLSLLGGAFLDVFSFFGLASVYTIIMIANLDDIRDRWIQCIGARDIPRVAKLTDEASLRISRYLTTSLTSNTAYGALFAIGLAILGVPQYLLWGALSIVFRFVPFVGGAISLLPPLFLSLGLESANSWVMPGYTLALTFGLEILFSQFVEPSLTGKHAGLSSLALVILTVFWTAIWGITGMMLATPLSVCIVTLGRHIPCLKILTVLFGEDELLDAPTRLYHRLMTNDLNGAGDVLNPNKAQLSSIQIAQICDALIIPTIHLAEHDYAQGRLTTREFLVFWRRARSSIPTLLAHYTASPEDDSSTKLRVMIVGISKEDEGIARIAQWALEAAGMSVVLRRVTKSRLASLKTSGRTVVIVSKRSAQKSKSLILRRLIRTTSNLVHYVWAGEETLSSKGTPANSVEKTSSVATIHQLLDTLIPKPLPQLVEVEADAEKSLS